MVEELGSARDQRIVDKQHLNLLSVFHFVGAGFALLGVLFIGAHYLLMGTALTRAAAHQGPSAPPEEFFALFKWFYALMGAWYGSSLVLNVLAGIYLRARKHRTFCIVVAALNCLHMPFGTVLGIFTIVVLARDSVRNAFAPQKYDGF